ncbi:hypothetical protein KC338_g2 [Hortaea werneckii]|nr:hypothetical protein KC338_g2 [Hortaea werneckii]
MRNFPRRLLVYYRMSSSSTYNIDSPTSHIFGADFFIDQQTCSAIQGLDDVRTVLKLKSTVLHYRKCNLSVKQ